MVEEQYVMKNEGQKKEISRLIQEKRQSGLTIIKVLTPLLKQMPDGEIPYALYYCRTENLSL